MRLLSINQRIPSFGLTLNCFFPIDHCFVFEFRRSSLNALACLDNGRRYGIFSKLGSGFQTMFRRFSTKYKTLSQLEIQILSTITHFNREEILQWHEKFLTDCPHGYMTRKQFIAMYASLCPNGNAVRFASHIFRAFDLDKSNTVDFREFLIGLSMTSTTSSPQTKLEWLFQVFDIDGNGLLTRNECLEVIDTIVRFNQSQQTDEQPVNTERLIREAKRSMMRIFDNISDGRRSTLTIIQFVEGCQKDEFISHLLAPRSGVANDSTITQNTYDISTTDEQ